MKFRGGDSIFDSKFRKGLKTTNFRKRRYRKNLKKKGFNPIAIEGEGWNSPTFLFFKFLKNGCYYQIQIWHACKANKMPSDQH